ncbi:MAG: M1 family metallopeptidase [Chitinophagaceae bacterium]
MKKLLAVLVLSYCQLSIVNCQLPYWQQQVNYTIDVSLNDKEHSLTGFEMIEYINNSPDTLSFIWFHIWPNAYKTDKTAFSDQLLENGSTAFYFSNKEDKGYINRLDFKVNNITAKTEDHPQHIDIIKLVLPSPVSPGQKITITTPFHVKLPYNYSRGGHDEQSYQATQWYPKPAVYDKKGWHAMTYLDQGEFYSEFGNFDVSITVPENYVVAATGELQNAEEKEWLKKRTSFTWQPIKKRIKKGSSVKTITQKFPVSATDIKTLRFKQDRIHDFAWFADKRFIVDHDTCTLAPGRVIDVYSYYTPQHSVIWKTSVKNAKDAIHHYSNLIGEYPYNIVSVVQGPESFGGGMEYPTITVISPTKTEKELDNTMAHEIGHNWFYGILASNERDNPWMDEGINSFYDAKYHQIKYGPVSQSERISFETKATTKTDQPILTGSEQFSESNYNLVAYYKTAEWLRYLESEIGEEAFKKGMQEYFKRWQFKHPQPEDFKKTVEESTGKNLDSVFSWLSKKGILPNQQRSGTQVASIIQPEHVNDSWYNCLSQKKEFVWIGPSIGINSYDKFMIGALITNYKLPPSRFQFLLAPMYGTGSKKLTGTGLANYTFYSDNIFKKVNLGVSASTFTINSFTDEEGNKTFSSFYKIVPSIKLTLKEKDPRSTLNRFIQFKTFLIGEDAFDFYRDTVVGSSNDTSIYTRASAVNENRVLNQLRIVSENYRALYPWRGELKIEQGENFIRTAFTGNYFFNYAKGGGLKVRLFAGKFFYTSPRTFTKQFETNRYHLNMTGPNGYEDYTYSDYFIGRNKFEGAASQQIMVRDGGFKIRTELLADKIGKTDNWLTAVNFSTTIPANINPLSVLPFKIPLKIFADIGTYADVWKKNSTEDRFLFDAGLHIPLLKETINIYIPLIYSKVYKDYIKSTLDKKNRFLKTISFSIDITGFSLRKFNRNFTD